ncbi:uncharacterized protein EV420DRAFT_490072 [Desarmillaria tabescens]|uniref:Uncharacterized protein n=1 Tax=Armillaria tabescens TaxID=1929756 RepID=A0AA39J259_ARMTA|nr:uncharacterized protein EV420DRAFT_490072 [Desarmillaria tabescens]KAK0433916.1 hypothetical protein EV420DRAFT_490072 [Desarmillaria tabescens]
MTGVQNPDALGVFLATRRDLTSLTQSLRVPAWRSPQVRMYLIPRVLARMDNLHSLVLPSIDLHIIQHHSAFDLRHIEFGDTHLSGQAEANLLTRLDGQTNVVSLRFPFLLEDDDGDEPPPSTPLPATRMRTRLLSARTTPSRLSLFPMPPLSPLPPTLIDVSITISTPIYAGFVLHPLSNPSLPLSAVSTLSSSPSVNAKKKRISEARSSHTPTLRNSSSKERACWGSVVSHFKALRATGNA